MSRHPTDASTRCERLADTLRRHTQRLHRQAEGSGVIRDLLQGQVSQESYALLLRNLLPVYRQLECGLEQLRRDHPARELAQPALYRAAAIEADLRALSGNEYHHRLPLLPAGRQYAGVVLRAAGLDGTRLIAHAYTRYLGDLNGGQLLRSLLQRSLGLDRYSLSFYSYPGLDPDEYRHHYRRAIDRAGLYCHDTKELVREAKLSFCCNIRISRQVMQAMQPGLMETKADTAFPEGRHSS